MNSIKPFLDGQGRIMQMPVKQSRRIEVLAYLGEKFLYDKIYSEKEVNGIINDWHTFGDYFLLRRELVDFEILCRTDDGGKYWRVK